MYIMKTLYQYTIDYCVNHVEKITWTRENTNEFIFEDLNDSLGWNGAARHARIDILEDLYERNSVKNPKTFWPRGFAMEYNQPKVIEWLDAKEIDPVYPSNDYKEVQLAVRNDLERVFNKFKYGGSWSCTYNLPPEYISQAARHGSIKVFREMWDQDYYEIFTLFCWSTEDVFEEAVRGGHVCILEYMNDEFIIHNNDWFKKGLELAIKCHKFEVFKWLIEDVGVGATSTFMVAWNLCKKYAWEKGLQWLVKNHKKIILSVIQDMMDYDEDT